MRIDQAGVVTDAAPPAWVPDRGLSDEVREHLREFLTPRRGRHGRLYWPVDELLGEARADA